MGRWRRALWLAGLPARLTLIALIRLYRVILGPVIGGSCRFHPSCSAYAEEAVRNAGAVRGSALAVWRILRCSPLSVGGVDLPPSARDWRPDAYDGVSLIGYDSVLAQSPPRGGQ